MALEHIEMRAANIRRRRKALKMTQEEVVDRMHEIQRERDPEHPDKTTGAMFSDWERAVNEPSAPKLELLAAALETTVGALSSRPDEKPAQDGKKKPTPDLIGLMSRDADEAERREAVDALQAKLDELASGQAELLSTVSEVRTAQEEMLSLLRRDERGRGEAGGR